MERNPGYPWQELQVEAFRPASGFWAERLSVFRAVTLPHVLKTLDDEGRLRNFDRAAGILEGGFEGHYRFDDSDVYKTLEGVAYVLAAVPDPDLEEAADRIIARIARAQMPDGYLFTWYQLKDPDARWTDMDSHEMYCGGHLMEAAAAYYHATGKTELLDVAIRLGHHYEDTFGPGRRHWVDGHEEVGLGLLRLAQATGDKSFADFAHWHIEERGHGHGRGAIWENPGFGARYAQDHIPVRAIQEAEGHSVRAMYLYAAMTDLVAMEVEPAYRPALDRAWDNIVHRKMYVTGGIGAVGSYEGFGPDYFLPNQEAYCETCAAIGMVFWNHRMNLLTGDARYADIVEQELYNGVLAGISLSGDRFFYVNPLESDGGHLRQPWFACACCPSNVARFLPGIARYFQAMADDGPVINQFVSGEARHEWAGRRLRIVQVTGYPFGGAVRLTLHPESPTAFSLRIRKPAWAASFSVKVNGEQVLAPVLDRGYLVLSRTFRPGDEVEVSFPFEARRLYADPRVEADRDRVALAAGPLVYCAEEADNPGGLVHLAAADALSYDFDPDLLSGLPVIRAGQEDGAARTFVPYFAWGNRRPGWMTVWIPETPSSPSASTSSSGSSGRQS